MIKKLLLILSIILLPVISIAQTTPGIADIINLTATPKNPVVGEISSYKVSFDITTTAHTELKNGSLLITFPEGFDISNTGLVTLSDNADDINYEVLKSVADGSNLSLQIKESKSKKTLTTVIDDTPDGYVSLSVTINNIINTDIAGSYQISLLAIRKNNTVLYGPGLSAPFEIYPSTLARIVVTPSEHLTLKAGDILDFHAKGYDRFDNFIDGIVYEWSIIDCEMNCIGELTDSTFLATTVGTGSISASANGLMRSSGILTILAGELDQVNLNIEPSQYVGVPLVGEAVISLADAYGNLLTDYDLSANPVTLSLGTGELTPNYLDNNDYFTNGHLDLALAGVKYTDVSVATTFQVSLAGINSEPTEINFNKYDLFQMLDANGEELRYIYSGVQNFATAVYANFGNRMASSELDFKTYFKTSQVVEHNLIIPSSPGELHQASIPILYHVGFPSVDTLIVELDSKFTTPEGEYVLTSKKEIEVEILPIPTLDLVENSLAPDSVIADQPFDVSFEISSPITFPLPDSVYVGLVVADTNNTNLERIFGGFSNYTFVDNQTLLISGLNSLVSSNLLNGNYGELKLNVDLKLYSGTSIFLLSDVVPFYVYPSDGLAYTSGTLAPQNLFAGSDVTFSFDLNNSFDSQVEILADDSRFTLKGGNYTASANLVTNGLLNSGSNLFESNRMFIPLELIGSKLTASASFKYLLDGISDTLLFETSFLPDTIEIDVASQPMVRILAFDIIAPNQPRVNVNQQFELSCIVANLSPELIDNLELGLFTDGPFNFDTTKFINLNPFDTVEIRFNVSAWSATTISDFIRVNILSEGLTILPAVDDIAIIAVETAADLVLDYIIFGAEGDVVDVGNNFDVDISLENLGDAEVTPANYQIVVNGLDLNGPDTINGTLTVNENFDYSTTAPQFDTTLVIEFKLLDVPIDLNSNLPAELNQNQFTIVINVITLTTEVLVETEKLGSNLLLPERQQEVLKFIVRNNSVNQQSIIKLEKFDFDISDTEGLLTDVRDIVNLANTGIFSNNIKVTSPVAGDNMLSLLFDEFLVFPQQEIELILKLELKQFGSSNINIKMSEQDLSATYVGGPNQGTPVPVVSANPGEPLFDATFVLKGFGLDKSFLIETNPFNPKEATAHFSYELTQASQVEFKIFTLMGELVYEKQIQPGEEGGQSGENSLFWDGRNDDGHIVNNGVYIAYLKNHTTDETAKIKVAVLK